MHLDTSFLIRALVAGSREDARITAWLRARRPIRISAPAWAEFLCGARDAPPLAAPALQLLGPALPFGPQEAATAAQLCNVTGRRRGSLLDCMIAATAVVPGASLATANTEDFTRFVPHGLLLAP